MRAELEGGRQQGRGVEEGVPVDAPVPGEFRVFQAGDHPEDAPLLRPGQLRLKSDDVVEDALPVLPAELDDGVGLAARPRIDQADRLHRPVGEGLDPPPGDHLDREAPFEAFDLLEGVEGDLLRLA